MTTGRGRARTRRKGGREEGMKEDQRRLSGRKGGKRDQRGTRGERRGMGIRGEEIGGREMKPHEGKLGKERENKRNQTREH